jgi:hypothetical protein
LLNAAPSIVECLPDQRRGYRPGPHMRVAVNIAKLPELLQNIAKISGEHIAQ